MVKVQLPRVPSTETGAGMLSGSVGPWTRAVSVIRLPFETQARPSPSSRGPARVSGHRS